MNNWRSHDVIIIDEVLAGTMLDCCLSNLGIQNLIIENFNHPRPHVREFLITSTTRIFEDNGFLEKIEHQGFAREYSAALHSQTAGVFSIKFAEFLQPGMEIYPEKAGA